MTSFDSTSNQDLYRLVCRPALPADTTDVMEMARLIWEGEDYLPYVWSDWLAEPSGLLAVAEFGRRVIGLGKLTKLSDRQWWLEGLRVHPEYEGRGVASRLHDYLLDTWLQTGSGVIRLVTASFRKPVHHLAQRTGFRNAGEYTPFVVDPVADPFPLPFVAVRSEEVEQAFKCIQQSELFRICKGLLDLGWQWATLEGDFLSSAIRRNQAWWWRDRNGLLIAREDSEGQERIFQIQLLACAVDDTARCLSDIRILGGEFGCTHVRWLAPLNPLLEPLLVNAEYRREWDASLFLFEKEQPAR